MFSDHHYLDANVNKAARFYVGIWNGSVVEFATSAPTSGGYELQRGEVTPKAAITAGDGIWINANQEGTIRICEVS